MELIFWLIPGVTLELMEKSSMPALHHTDYKESRAAGTAMCTRVCVMSQWNYRKVAMCPWILGSTPYGQKWIIFIQASNCGCDLTQYCQYYLQRNVERASSRQRLVITKSGYMCKPSLVVCVNYRRHYLTVDCITASIRTILFAA